jgi:hypothetical protein
MQNDMVTISTAARTLNQSVDNIYRKLRAGRVSGAVKQDGVWMLPADFINAELLRLGKER